MVSLSTVLHIFLHFFVPLVVAGIAYRKQFLRTWLIMSATILVDLDHLLATPVFDPNRCSIGFHPLHSYLAIGIYTCMLLTPKLRVMAIGLLIHMGLDYVDCLGM